MIGVVVVVVVVIFVHVRGSNRCIRRAVILQQYSYCRLVLQFCVESCRVGPACVRIESQPIKG